MVVQGTSVRHRAARAGSPEVTVRARLTLDKIVLTFDQTILARGRPVGSSRHEPVKLVPPAFCAPRLLSARNDGGTPNATASILHQCHVGRLRRPSRGDGGRRNSSLWGRDARASRRSAVWPGNVRNDGVGMAVVAGRRAAGLDGRLDGTLCPG